jgi:glucans biosynthesis protein
MRNDSSLKFSISVSLFLCLITPLPALASPKAIHFSDVQKIAKKLSMKPYAPPADHLPEAWKTMGYDQWRDLRFKRSLWAEDREPFKVQFFHPGFIYNQPVTIHVIDEEGTREYKFSSELFDYAKTKLARHAPSNAGFAGFRIHYPINTPDYYDEIVAFLGASYFRALPKGLFYGMSVRGLAINTADEAGEEFPFFKEFWIVKPAAKDKKITVYALLDSPSVVGAYEYDIYPGAETIMSVKSTLLIRQKIEKLGLAPLTSMYFYGENTKAIGAADYRPEVHDSDGLLISSRSGEWIWRPLDNPERLSINSFYVGTPRGFGLLQRDFNFDHYQDLEARYEMRPSVWVEVAEDWGPGHVELVQIPTKNEYNDNMVAFWVPEKKPQPGAVLNYSYRLHWHAAKDRPVPLGYVTDTRIIREDKLVRFILDFQGKDLAAISGKKHLEADLSVSKGYKILNRQLFKNLVTGGWRMVFQVQIDHEGLLKDMLPSTRPACELRAIVKDKGKTLTETWTYTLVP